MDWKKNKTKNRFVAFFDILGFKDMVSNHDHKIVLEKLEKLKLIEEKLGNLNWDEKKIMQSGLKINEKNQTKSVTFSDTFIFFSYGDTVEDFFKIMIDSYSLLKFAIEFDISIKGAVSFGEITVDFEKSLFFGQPIIDAYLLHEDLHMLGVVLDHNAENKKNTFGKNLVIHKTLKFEKVKMKYGFVSHTLITQSSDAFVLTMISNLKKLYTVTSGKSRLYIDNTIDYYTALKNKTE